MKAFLAQLVAMLMAASSAWAQGRTFVLPSITIAEIYDDNVFVTPSAAQPDEVFRTSPSLRAGYDSPRLLLEGQYTIDAERYADHPELNNALARQRTGLHLNYQPTRVLTLSADGSYWRTNTPQEFNLVNAIAEGRALADRASVTPTATLQFSPRDQGRIAFEWTRDAFLGAPAGQTPESVDTRELTLEVARKLQPVSTVVADYQVRWFVIGGAPVLLGGVSGIPSGLSGTSQVALFGWDRRLTPLTDLTLRAGPRVSDGSVRPEWTAGLRRRMSRGEIALSVARTESVALGESGILDTESATLKLTARPVGRLELSVGPGFTRDRTRDGSLNAKVAVLDVTASNPITQRFSLYATYHRTMDRNAGPIIGESTIRQTILTIGIVVRTLELRRERL